MKVLLRFDFKDSYTLNVLSGFDFKRLSHYESFLQVLFKKTLTCAFQIAFDQKVDADHYLEEALMEQVFSYNNFLEPSPGFELKTLFGISEAGSILVAQKILRMSINLEVQWARLAKPDIYKDTVKEMMRARII